MKIYGLPISIHVRKVILAARLKGIPFTLDVVIPAMPGNPPANWREISPTGLIPVIEDDGFRLGDSTAIVGYLDRKVPEPAVLPAGGRAFGEALFLDAWAGGVLFRDVVNPILRNQVVRPKFYNQPGDEGEIEAALAKAAEAFAYLEGRASEDFLVGDSLTIADLAVVSNLIVFHYLGRRIDPRFPRLETYFRRSLDRSPIRETFAEEAPFADKMGLDRTFAV